MHQIRANIQVKPEIADTKPPFSWNLHKAFLQCTIQADKNLHYSKPCKKEIDPFLQIRNSTNRKNKTVKFVMISVKRQT